WTSCAAGTCLPTPWPSWAPWISSSERSTDEGYHLHSATARGLRVHPGERREGEGLYRALSGGQAGKRRPLAALSGAGAERRLAFGAGDRVRGPVPQHGADPRARG